MAALMRKASATFKGTYEGHKELQHVISEQKNVKAAHKQFIRAQGDAASYGSKWAAQEQNPVLQDLFARLLELQRTWATTQTLFTDCVKENRKCFENVLVREKQLDNNIKARAKAEKGVKAAEKDVAKAERKGENVAASEVKLHQARSLYDIADKEYEEHSKDIEIYKHHIVKDSLMKMNSAYLELFERGKIVFEAQKELLDLIPNDPPNITGDTWYTSTGVEASTNIVQTAQEALMEVEATHAARAGKTAPRHALSRTHSTAQAAQHGFSNASSTAEHPPAYTQDDPFAGLKGDETSSEEEWDDLDEDGNPLYASISNDRRFPSSDHGSNLSSTGDATEGDVTYSVPYGHEH